MTSDGHNVDQARDVRDAQSDHNDFIMNREVYCGKPVFGAGQQVVDLEDGFVITLDDDDNSDHWNFI